MTMIYCSRGNACSLKSYFRNDSINSIENKEITEKENHYSCKVIEFYRTHKLNGFPFSGKKGFQECNIIESLNNQAKLEKILGEISKKLK